MNNKTLSNLLEFYSNSYNLKLFVDVVVLKKKDKYIPLRVFEWFVTNYTKKNNIYYDIERPNSKVETFYVYRSYQAQLKGNKKKEFDPFCRCEVKELQKLEYKDSDGKIYSFHTSIGQLNFFRWVIQNLIIDYITKNYTTIYDDMEKNYKNKTNKKTELSKSIYKSIIVNNNTTTIITL
jgi:hypothetical protein